MNRLSTARRAEIVQALVGQQYPRNRRLSGSTKWTAYTPACCARSRHHRLGRTGRSATCPAFVIQCDEIWS